MQTHVVIIGAGPAGLTAAYLLSKEGKGVTVLEADAQYVGGIARTVTYQGYCFDIGGHRFFSKSKEIEALWSELLPNDMLERPRSSRIFYRQQFFSYPLKAFEALYKLGIIESLRCVFSYGRAKCFPIKNPSNFSDWVTNHFGKRLFSIFFKTYTEKVWGMRCEDISADWASQRIKGLSLLNAITHAIFPKKWFGHRKKLIKTLIGTFRYPRKGPGMLWEACAEKIKQYGGEVILGGEVYGCEYDVTDKIWKINYRYKNETKQIIAKHLISSAPLKALVMDYLPTSVLSSHAKLAAHRLSYRDFLIVVVILKDKNQFSDNWIYIHDSKVEVARIQNFKSWSEEMVPDKNMCCYGLEYFCFKEDNLWASPDEVLIQKAISELVLLGLATPQDIQEGCVVRQSKAYPVYDTHYQQHVNLIRRELEEKFPTLYLVGRNGMHKYNNQDHAMMTAILTVKNILQGNRAFDVWQVNQDAEYHEFSESEKSVQEGLRLVPKRLSNV